MDQPCGRTRLAKAIVVAAPQSGSGKTLFTLGLIRALRNANIKVASAKLGPDYIDPHFHAAASGNPCINLDLWAMGKANCAAYLAELGLTSDVVVIEGVMGLFDGPQGASGSTADFAEALDLPVILVIDASHQAQSVGALIHGFRSYRPTLELAGVVFNRVKSDRHATILADAAKSTPILGLLRQNTQLQLPSRHLGLVQAQENQHLETFIDSAAAAVTRETNLDKLLEIGTEIPNQHAAQLLPPLGQHMAIAADQAFSFAYPHLLQGWRKQGAELSFFSPLANEAPSSVADAVFLPGGYPELHAEKIASANVFMAAMQLHTGLIYGECGGYMVMGRSLIDEHGKAHKMAGLLPVTTSFARRTLQLGYRQLAPRAGPWTMALRGHEFHYSTLAEHGGEPLFDASDAAGRTLGSVGSRIGKAFGSYAHVIAPAP
jgi:cobyrinic acid a,c-diamide synthase